MNLLIHDANILIDLIKLDCIHYLFSLDYEMYTTNAVRYELYDEQKRILDIYIAENKLKIRKIEDSEDDEVTQIFNENEGVISYPDATVYYVSKKMGGYLLTGDQNLRLFAEKYGVEVKGIIWLFDEMKRKKVLTLSLYKEFLKKLEEMNPRLPKKEIEKRIK